MNSTDERLRDYIMRAKTILGMEITSEVTPENLLKATEVTVKVAEMIQREELLKEVTDND